MARSLLPPPPSSPSSEFHPLIHQALIIALVAAWIAAAIAIISFLCAPWHRKSSSSKTRTRSSSPLYDESNRNPSAQTTTTTTTTTNQVLDPQEEEEEEKVVVELSPDAATHGPIPPAVVTKSLSSKRKLSVSLSIKLHEKMAAMGGKKEKEEAEETIWKRAIILGEKCKIPSDNEEEDVAATGGRLSRQASYRSPATPTTSLNIVNY